MDLDVPPCPRCGRIPPTGTRCLACAGASASIPATPPAPPAPRVGLEMTPARWAKTPAWKTNLWRAGAALAVLIVFAIVYVRCGERPSFLSLSTTIDGPSPAKARRTLLFLHGHGGSNGSVAWVADALRKAGLPDDVSIVFVEAPFSHVEGRTWGHYESQLQRSEDRVRELIGQRFDPGTAPSKVFIAGFSQGAGIAADVAAKDPRVGGVASISACRFRAEPELAAREGLAILVAHGDHDSVCPPRVSRALVDRLRAAGRQPVYVDFVDDHVITPTVIRRLVDFVRLAS